MFFIGWLGKKQECWRKTGAAESGLKSSEERKCKFKKANNIGGKNASLSWSN